MSRLRTLIVMVVLTLLAVAPKPAHGSFHLWHVKEVFSNADGSVQFIELFNSFSSEQFVANQTLRTNSDGVIKNFVIPGNLSPTPPATTANTHFLVATPLFSSQPGAVTPDFTLPDPSVEGVFFNPNAANITITFLGSSDSLSFAGSLLPKDGFQSLTDMNATGFPPGTPNITVTDNTPTKFPNVAGQIDLRSPSPTGDYNGNGVVDAADFVVWRKTLNEPASPAGSGADGDGDGTIDDDDYDFWAARFGDTVPGAGGGNVSGAVPEPASFVLLLVGLLVVPLRLLALGPRRDPALGRVLRR